MREYAKIAIGFLLVFLMARSCMSMFDSDSSSSKYVKSPIDTFVRDMTDVPTFSIVLFDMDYVNNTFGSDVFRHKYQIMTPPAGEGDMQVKETEWMDVSESFFQANANNMGMELVSKTDGKLDKTVAPAGYSQYVGNSQYGQWVDRGGSSFWEFYGKYAMMSSIFNMMAMPASRSYYDDYSRNYRNQGRPYYGSTTNGGTPRYGTSSTVSSRGGTSQWSKSQSTFKSRVQNRVSRSSSTPSRSSVKSGSSSRTRRPSSSGSFRMRGGRRR